MPKPKAPSKDHGHSIPQPILRDLRDDERFARHAGLRFILKNQFRVGERLDERMALLLNTAHHTQILNRFSETSKVLREDPALSYETLDRALQDFAEAFKYTPRALSGDGAERPAKPLTEAERQAKALEAFARSRFRTVAGGKGLGREEYERTLAEWIKSNHYILTTQMAAEDLAMAEVTSMLSDEDLSDLET